MSMELILYQYMKICLVITEIKDIYWQSYSVLLKVEFNKRIRIRKYQTTNNKQLTD